MTTNKSSNDPAKADAKTKKAPPQRPLTRSNADAKRDIAKLESSREQLQSEAPETDSDARASLF